MREMAFSVCVRFGLVLRSPSPFSGLPIPSGSRVRISPSTAGPRRRPGSALNIFMTEEAPSVSDGGKKNDVSVSNEKDVSTSKSIDSIMESSSNSEDAANPNQPKPQYSLRTRLREETEAPFRKARMFVYGGSAVSAGVGAFIATLRIISALFGTSGVQPLNETVST